MDTFLYNIKLWITGVVLVVGLSAYSQTISFNIQGLNIEEQDTFVVALQTGTELTGEDIFAYRFYVTYSTSYFTFLGIDSVGDVLDAWGLPTINATNPGVIRLAGAGSEALAGSGDVIYLKFRSLRSGGSYIGFDVNQSYLNEGAPASTYTSGYISAAARSYPNIYPDSGQLFIGDGVTLSTSGGMAPYTYGSSNAAVALIEEGNILRAVGPGLTRAYVTDANDEVNYSSGFFDIRAVRMSMPNDVTGWPTQTILLPLEIEVAPGTQVFSGMIELSYPAGVTPSEDPVQPGDYALSMERRVVDNRVYLSFATATAITGNGVLVYIPFIANYSGNHYIVYQSTRFNENLLSYNSNDYIRVNTLPALSISPNSGSLLWNETVTLSVSNGNPPYSYEVSHPQYASVDEAGIITGLSGGTFRVTVTDDYGATATTGIFTVYDHTLTIANADGNLDEDTRVTVSTSQLPSGRDIFSFEGTLIFNPNHLDFVSVEPLNSGMIIESVVDGGTIHLVGASTTGISSGDVFYLNFRIKNTVNILGSTSVLFGSFSINEAQLYSVLVNGIITRVTQDSYRPVADAGNNFSADENTLVQLDGSGSYDLDDDPLTYVWKAPAGITLDDPTLVNPSFTAPEVTQNTVYTFKLVANDGTSDSDTSAVNVTILQVNKTPTANAGMDASYPEGNSVTLDGTASSDPDGQALIYNWESLDGIVLFNVHNAKPSFIAPGVESDTNFRFRLVVNDGIVDSEADTVVIEVLQVNQIPEAFAGTDQTVNEGDFVQLDGSLSSDPDNDQLSYLWTAPPELSLSSNTIAQPTFTAPDVHYDSTLVFILVVNDGQSNSLPDEVKIHVNNIDILSTEAEILSVSLPGMVSADIKSAEATVVLHMPYGYDIRNLAPLFDLSEFASVNPGNGTHRDFSLPQTYVVTAEDLTTTKSWTVSIYVPVVSLSRNIASGWNMLSLPLIPADAALDEVLSSLTFEQLDYIKSPFASATWYAGLGWYGDLDEFPNFLTIKLNKNTAETLQVMGSEINPTLESIPVVSGWNSLPYLLNADADINSAIIPATIPNGEVLIKGEAGASVYYAGSGWVGDITQLNLMHGYKIKVQYFGNIRFDASAVQAAQPVAGLKTIASPNNFSHQYNFSANLIGELADENGNPLTDKGDRLMAYNNGVLCGQTNAVYAGDLNRYIFVLSYYGNAEDEAITFKVLHQDRELDLDKEILFRIDEVIGGAYKPEALSVSLSTGIEDGKEDRGFMVSPNPAYDMLNITSPYNITKVRIYNAAGSMVYHSNHSGKIQHISISEFPPGVYIIQIDTHKSVYLQRFIKRRK